MEQFLNERVAQNTAGLTVPWNFTAAYAVEQIAMLVFYRAYYRDRFDAPDHGIDSALTDAGREIGDELKRTLYMTPNHEPSNEPLRA